MNAFAKGLAVMLLGCVPALAADQAVFESTFATQDLPLELDPASPFWSAARPVYMEKDPFGKPVPRYRTEVRSRWTKANLYFLFICPYEQLHLKPEPNTHQETNELWNWDVAEVFVGSDFADIRRYKEFEVSPQGEWIDLDVNLHDPHHEGGWRWNSGFEVSATIDQQKHIWYGAMRIPLAAIDARAPAPGNVLRLNLFRSQGPPEHLREITWQPSMSKTFHVPEHFGLVKLEGGEP
jgi:cellulose/xylan binding protein with CBM9 domain